MEIIKDKSKIWMKEATMILLQSKTYEDISVKDILDKAGIARSVFYYHYNSKEELFEEIMIEGFELRCKELIETECNIDDALKKFISFVYSDKEMVVKLHSTKTSNLVSKLIIRIFTAFYERFEHEMQIDDIQKSDAYIEYVVGVSSSIVETLIRRNFVETEDEIYHIITSILNT